MKTRTILPLLSLCVAFKLAAGAEIFMITLGGTRSHKIPFLALAKGLISRGHRVTFVNGFVPDGVAIDGLRQVTPSGLVNYIGNYTNWDLLGSRYAGKAAVPLWRALRYPAEACNSLLQDNDTLELLTQPQQQQQQQQQQQHGMPHTIAEPQYQLAILDGAFPECALGIVQRLSGGGGGGGVDGAGDGGGGGGMMPFIYINTVGFYTGSLALAGNPIVYAVTPHVFTALTHTMDFWQRVQNYATHLVAELLHKYYTWQVHGVLRAQLDPRMPHPYALARNVSFILQNGHATLTYPRPLLPNVAEIACIHCRAALPLAGELADFVAAAPLGVILFSMGSSVRAANMPPEVVTLLASVFARLPQYHVLWKWEDGDGRRPDVSSNVRLSAWLPQQDVLGHERLKLFITHGGLLSMYEAVYHAVPMVMLPVFCDHDVNAAKAASDGYALRLSLRGLTAQALLDAVQEVLQRRKYRRAVRQHQTLLLDQPVAPLENAIYWTEYVLRHGGATHLHAASSDMSFLAYYSLDVLLAFLAAIWLLRLLLRRLRRCMAAALFRQATRLKRKAKD